MANIERRVLALEAKQGQGGETFEVRMAWDPQDAVYLIDGQRVTRRMFFERCPQDDQCEIVAGTPGSETTE